MGFLDRLKAIFGGGATGSGAAAASEPAPSPAQKGSAGTGVATGDPAPASIGETDPASQSAAVEQTPDEQRQSAAQDPAGTVEPGSEGQGQEPR